jgi:predicted dehydrogenase
MQPNQNETKTKKKDKVRYAVVGLGYIAQIAVLPAFAAVSKPPQLVKAASPGLD